MITRCIELRQELAELLLTSSGATGEQVVKEVMHTKGTIDTLEGISEAKTIIELIENANLLESEDDNAKH